MGNHRRASRLPKREAGVATLVTAVVLMLAVFGVTYFMSESVIQESRIVSNDLRAKEAFLAAQSGLELGRTLESTSYALSSAELDFTLIITGSGGLYSITSVGQSKDGTVERQITAYTAKLPGEVNPPKVPIVARGAVGLTGNLAAVNNESAITVWTGSDTGVQGSANTYIAIDDQRDQLSTIKSTGGGGGSTATYGPDVIAGDSNLANSTENQILESFFGVELEPGWATADYGDTYGDSAIQKLGSTMESTDLLAAAAYDPSTSSETDFYGGDSTDVDLSSPPSKLLTSSDAESISPCSDGSCNWWDNIDFSVTGSNVNYSSSNRYIGTPDKPVRIVVDGEVTLPSNTVIFGQIVARNIRMTGNTFIVGGMVALSDNDDSIRGSGTPRVIMSEIVLDTANNPSDYGPVKSSWKDW